jgi:hypothetical protein
VDIFSEKQTKSKKRAEDVAKVAKCLPSKHEALSSVPSTVKNETTQKGQVPMFGAFPIGNWKLDGATYIPPHSVG